jgi:type I restriction enzyme S subunit
MRKYTDQITSTNEIVGVKCIPKHWRVIKLKYIAKIFNGQDQKEVLDENGIYPIYGSGGVFGYSNKYLFEGPSVLLGRKGTVNKPRLVEKPFWSVDTAYYTKISKKVNVYFFYHLCNQINFDYYIYGSAVPSMTASDLNNIKFPLPPLQEQQRIVNYLDYKTNQIDQFIANRQRQIELFREQKANIILKAVTKGINSKINTKPSNIEWIGDVPVHWEIWKVSRLFKTIGSGTTPKAGTPKYYENGIIPWVNTGDLNDGILEDCKTYISQEAFDDHSTLKLYKKNTLLIAMYGATIGKLSILDFEACTNQACCALGNSKIIDIDFAYYWFLSQKQNIINLSYGGGQPNISQDVVKNIRIPLPTIEVQKQINRYIQKETSTIDSLISKYQKQIDLMQDYRTSLISQAVTGKIDVRDWKPQIKK